jgi:2'-5' RNA ligase
MAEERRSLPPARWVHPDNLHLTLTFLGPVEDAALPALGAALEAAFAAHPPLTLRLAGAGCFPPPAPAGRRRPARVAWVGIEVEEGAERLRAVQAAVDGAARSVVGLPEEARPWSAHLTLARPREPWRGDAAEAFAAAFSPPLGEAFRVESGVLVASEPGRGPGGGSLYRAVARYPLAVAVEAGG